MAEINSHSDQPTKEPIDSFLEKMREGSPEETVKKAGRISKEVEMALLSYMNRPESDPAILQNVEEMVRYLSLALQFGDGMEPLGQGPSRNVKAGLIGAARIFDPGGETRSPVVSPPEVGLARHFLELTERRVGRIDP